MSMQTSLYYYPKGQTYPVNKTSKHSYIKYINIQLAPIFLRANLTSITTADVVDQDQIEVIVS